jgi:hypothetical protein
MQGDQPMLVVWLQMTPQPSWQLCWRELNGLQASHPQAHMGEPHGKWVNE